MAKYVVQMSKEGGEPYQILDKTARAMVSDEVTAREVAVAAETAARQEADQAEATARETAIAAEAEARETAVDAEKTAREAADSNITIALSHRKGYTLSVGSINDHTDDDMDNDKRLRTSPIKAEASKIILELPENYYAYVFTYDENGTFNDETGWYSGTNTLNVIENGYFRLVIKKGSEGTQTPSVEEAYALSIKQLGPYYSAFTEQVPLTDPIYIPDMVFEQGTLDKYGINKINSEFPGNKRIRTAGYVRIVDGIPIYFDTPTTSLVYACLYDEFFQFVRRMEYSASNDPLVLQTQGAKWLRFVIWHTDNSDVSEKELNAIRVMQPTGIVQKDSIHPENKYGGLVDYSGKLNNDNDGLYYQTRVCTDYIPILNRKALINLPEGYNAYLYEMDKDFKFIKERGWLYFTSYYGLNSETKYIRLVYKRNDEWAVGEQDIQNLSNVTISFETTEQIRKSNPLFFEPTLIAHRGDIEAPENTLPAIERAIEKGYKQIEVDIQFTLDGVCVLLHDNTIDRTSNGTGAIYNMTYETALQYDFGSWKSQEYEGTKIPTLEQALLLCKKNKVTLQIDFNDGNKSNITYHNVADMLRVVKKCGMESNVVLCCREFHMRYAAYLNPNIALCTGVYTDEDIQRVEDIAARVSLFVASMQDNGSIIKETIEKRHEHNMLFQTWTINNQQTADNFFDNGADWLITENLSP